LKVTDIQSSFKLRTVYNESTDFRAFYKCFDKSNYTEIEDNVLKPSVLGRSSIWEQAVSIMNLNKSKLISMFNVG